MKNLITSLLGLLLLVGLTAAAMHFYNLHIAEQLPLRAVTLLSLATMLLGGWIVGIIFHQCGLPRICGYLLFGIVIGPSPHMLNILPSKEHVVHDLSFINYLAISLIALTAGGEINLSWLRGKVKQISILVVIEVVLVLLGTVICFALLGSHLPFLHNASLQLVLIVGLLTSMVVIANSPTVVIAIISDYKAKGPLSQTTLTMTVAKDMLLIALFATVVVTCKTLLSPDASLSADFVYATSFQLLGSISLGALVGALMALYVEKVHAHLGIFIVGCCMLFALIGEQHITIGLMDAHLEPLLMAVAAGFVMENIYPQSSTPLFHRIEQLSLPVYVLFFTLAGAKIDTVTLIELWYFAVGLAIIRAVLIWGSVRYALRKANITDSWAKHLWLGLLPQAGVSLVLITIIATKFSDYEWALPLSNLVIGMIVCNELLGPVLFRWALFKNSEARAE